MYSRLEKPTKQRSKREPAIMKGKELPNITIGDLLAEMDTSIIYLLERRYLDRWHHGLNVFVPSHSRLSWRDDFFGLNLRGLRYYGEQDRDLALQNMENILSLFRDGSHSFLLTLDGREGKIPELSFLSCRTTPQTQSLAINSRDYADLLRRGFRANFPGALVQEVTTEQYADLTNWVYKCPFMGILTGIPGRKRPEEKFFAQGLERFLDTVTGLDFACLMVAQPYTVKDIIELSNPVLSLKNEIGKFRHYTLTHTDSITDTTGHTISLGAFLSGGITDAVSNTISSNYLKLGSGIMSGATAAGAAIGAGIGTFLAGPVGTFLGGTIGTAIGTVIGVGGALVSGLPLTQTVAETISHATSLMGGGFGSYARTKSRGYTKGLSATREAINYSAEYALQHLDNYLERLHYARSYGLWNVGFYCFAADKASYLALKNAATANFSGEKTFYEPIRFADIAVGEEDQNTPLKAKQRKGLINEIVAGFNPRLEIFVELGKALSEGPDGDHHPLGKCFDGLSTPMTTGELAILAAPPQRECRALSVTRHGTFGGKAFSPATHADKPRLELGTILYYGDETGEKLDLALAELTRHSLICGITGSGKTNTVMNWCHQLSQAGIPWMVVEPSAKREYRQLVSTDRNSPLVFSLGTEGINPWEKEKGVGAPFRFNPFYFSQGVNLLTHIDNVKAAFNAAFPMYASMPYILEEAIIAIYRDYGWNIVDSTNRFSDNPWDPKQIAFLFPTLKDLHAKIDEVVARKRYDQRLQMDISAALRARISSLMAGSKGVMLNTPVSLDFKELMGTNIVFEMGYLGSDEEKALIMAFMIISIYEQATRGDDFLKGPLKHVFILEEAHRLLRNASPADNPEIANVRGMAVEQFANMLAEMRALGEGIIIVDQTPSRLVPEVIKNTNVKVIHQLCAADDRKIVGESIILDNRQQEELARLRPGRGETVVFNQKWEKAYCLKTPLFRLNELDYRKLENNRKYIIEKFPLAYGEDGSNIGKHPDESDPDLQAKIARALFGLALNNLSSFESGVADSGNPVSPLEIILNPIPKRTTHPHEFYLSAAFQEFIKDFMRVTSSRLRFFTECPEMFTDLVRQIATGKSMSERQALFQKLRKTFIDSGDPQVAEEEMNRVAARYYARQFELGRIPLEISQVVKENDSVYQSLKEQIVKHVNKICGDGANNNDFRRRIELYLVEQAIILAGFLHGAEIVEVYRRKFS
jgi:hypothetical protein